MRTTGGLLYFADALIMVYNIWRTIRGDVRQEKAMGGATAPAPAAAAAAAAATAAQ